MREKCFYIDGIWVHSCAQRVKHFLLRLKALLVSGKMAQFLMEFIFSVVKVATFPVWSEIGFRFSRDKLLRKMVYIFCMLQVFVDKKSQSSLNITPRFVDGTGLFPIHFAPGFDLSFWHARTLKKLVACLGIRFAS